MIRKVICWNKDYNTCSNKNKFLTHIEGNVHYFLNDNKVFIVIEKDGIYHEYGFADNMELINENIDKIKYWGENIIQVILDKSYPTVIDLQFFSELGMDTAPLIAKREAKAEENKRKKEGRLKAEEERQQRLAQEYENRYQNALSDFKDGEIVDMDFIEEFCKRNDIKIQPRTLGAMRNRNVKFKGSMISLDNSGASKDFFWKCSALKRKMQEICK